jgi:hypothetical protein
MAARLAAGVACSGWALVLEKPNIAAPLAGLAPADRHGFGQGLCGLDFMISRAVSRRGEGSE